MGIRTPLTILNGGVVVLTMDPSGRAYEYPNVSLLGYASGRATNGGTNGYDGGFWVTGLPTDFQ